MNNMQRINPNDELKALNNCDHRWRQLGLNTRQIAAIKAAIIKNQRESEYLMVMKSAMVLLGIFGNVLHGNDCMETEKIKACLEECCTLFYEVDLALLDWDDIVNYNIKNMDCTIEFTREDLLKNSCAGGTFKVSGMKSTSERAREVMLAEEERLDSLIEAAEENGHPSVKECAAVYKKEFERIKQALSEANVI